MRIKTWLMYLFPIRCSHSEKRYASISHPFAIKDYLLLRPNLLPRRDHFSDIGSNGFFEGRRGFVGRNMQIADLLFPHLFSGLWISEIGRRPLDTAKLQPRDFVRA